MHSKMYEEKELKDLRAFACVVCWGIWLARNHIIFESKYNPPFQIMSKVGCLFFGSKYISIAKPIR
jgi:hypothetical protein